MEPELESDLRIPTRTLQVRVKCVDGRDLSGRLFVPTSSSSHPGPMLPEERLNDSGDFFPLAIDDQATVFVNKLQVVSVAVSLDELRHSVGESHDVVPVSGATQRVAIECHGVCIEGDLIIDMPECKRRVLDYLNRGERFLSLRNDCTLHLINREQVLRVFEVGKE